MKRLILTVCLFSAAVSSLFAELYPSKRFFEMGFTADVSATENLMPLEEVFVKDLVIDFSKIYADMGDDGFVLTAALSPELYTDLNIGDFGAGLHLGLDLASSLGVSKEFFRLLAEGNDLGTESSTDLNVSFESFLTTSVPVKFKVGSLKFKVTPSYFIPLVYVPNPDATVSVIMNEDGTMQASVNAPLDVYTLVDANGLFTQEGISEEIESMLTLMLADIPQAALTSAGLDINAVVEYPLLKGLDVGAYANVPVVPGTLRHKISTTASVTANVDGLLNSFASSGSEDSENSMYHISDAPYYSDPVFSDASYTVNRPFRLGVEAAWRPLGSWLTLRPRLGFAARNPFGQDFSIESCFPEYSLSAEATLLYVLGLTAKTEYTNKVYAQSLGLSFNIRVAEIDVGVATSSADFAKSFSLSGMKAFVGFKCGL